VTLGAPDLKRLEKVLDSTEMLMPDFYEVVQSDAVKAILEVSNHRDFVLGVAYAYAMANFALQGRATYSQSEAIELLSSVLVRLSIIDQRRAHAQALHDAAVE
jgi:hypothetical protein